MGAYGILSIIFTFYQPVVLASNLDSTKSEKYFNINRGHRLSSYIWFACQLDYYERVMSSSMSILMVCLCVCLSGAPVCVQRTGRRSRVDTQSQTTGNTLTVHFKAKYLETYTLSLKEKFSKIASGLDLCILY